MIRNRLNEKGGAGIVMAVIPGIVIFTSFFLINSAIRQGAALNRRQLEISKVEKVMIQLSQQIYSGFLEGASDIVVGAANCNALTDKVDHPAAPAPVNGQATPRVCVTNGLNTVCTPDPDNPGQNFCVDGLTAQNIFDQNQFDKSGVRTLEVKHSLPVPLSTKLNNVARRWTLKAGTTVAALTEPLVPEPVMTALNSIPTPFSYIEEAHAQTWPSPPPLAPEAGDTDITFDIPDCSVPDDPLDNGNCFQCADINTYCYRLASCPPDQAPCVNSEDFHYQTIIFRR